MQDFRRLRLLQNRFLDFRRHAQHLVNALAPLIAATLALLAPTAALRRKQLQLLFSKADILQGRRCRLVIGDEAVLAIFTRQTLRHNQRQGGGNHEAWHAHIEQARNRRNGVICVQGR